jgi:hypothetical protein
MGALMKVPQDIHFVQRTIDRSSDTSIRLTFDHRTMCFPPDLGSTLSMR